MTDDRQVLYAAAALAALLNLFVFWYIASRATGVEGFANQPGKNDTPDAIPYDVLTLPDVLTAEECDRLMVFAGRQAMSSSKVWNGDPVNPDQHSEHRSSKQAWVNYDDKDVGDIVRKLRKKAAQLTGVYDPASFEKVQLAKYAVHGEYKQHYDSCTSKCPQNKLCRVATLLVYLNEPVAGGDTVFPNMGISITPKKGSASFFYNVDVLDPAYPELAASLHAGAPVEAGDKFIANVWVMCPPSKAQST
jgi:prolyl 4-hydroxylase